MRINIKKMLYLPMILFFFPAFSFVIPGTFVAFKYFYIITIYIVITMFVLNFKNNIYILDDIIKKTPLKYYLLMLLVLIINSILLIGLGVAKAPRTIIAIIMQVFLGITPIITYFLIFIRKYVGSQLFLKVFILCFWLDLIIGFISYIGQFFDIKIINDIFDFLANYRIINLTRDGYDSLGKLSNYTIFGLPRLDNLYEEPGWYARFLYLFLPIVYYSKNHLLFDKYKILCNIIRKTIIPFTWLSIILTMSPIYLVFSCLISIIYYFKSFIQLIKRHFIMLSIVLILVIVGFNCLNLNFSNSYLSRIINIFYIRSFEDFMIMDNSLATRINSYVNALYVFKNNLLGVGLNNLDIVIIKQFFQSPIPLTHEIIAKISLAIRTNTNFHTNPGFIYIFLAENGIVVFLILIFFFMRLYQNIEIVLKNQKINCNKSSYMYTYALKITLIATFILFFYELYLINLELLLIIILCVLNIYHYKIKKGGI